MLEKFKFLASNLWTFLYPFIKVLLTNAGKALVVSAAAAVKHVQDTAADAKPTVKFAMADAMVRSDMQKQGIILGTTFITTVIEAAVLKLKEAQ